MTGHKLLRLGAKFETCCPACSWMRKTTENLRHPQVLAKRQFSVSPKPSRQQPTMNIFDRNAKRIQKDRAAIAEDSHVYDYIREEVAFRLSDRVFDIKRKFDVVVDLGCNKGQIGQFLTDIYSVIYDCLMDVVGVLYNCDMSVENLKRVKPPSNVPHVTLLADEEHLPFPNSSIDLVLSSLSLHWVNNLPGTFRQIHNALKNDGVFLGAMFGGDTLFELRCALQLAETEREGGFAAHISPFTAVQDVGHLLHRAGFTMLTVDVDEVKVNYPSMMEVMWDVKGMGESNAAWNRKSHLHRDTIAAAISIYKEMYGNADGSVPATYQIIYMIGWKPDPSQPKAAERGSATASLKDLSKVGQIAKELPKPDGK